jgi:hypothetical protein
MRLFHGLFALLISLPLYANVTVIPVTDVKVDLENMHNASLIVKEIHISEVEIVDDLNTAPAYSYNVENYGKSLASAGKLIALGEKIWEIIKKGKPVVKDFDFKPLSVLPKTESGDIPVFEMSNWSAPKAARFKIDYKNLWGISVVSFYYNVSFQYNGMYQGKGAYLTGINVTASNLEVMWGFNFDASVEVISIANTGSIEAPVASVTLKIKQTSKTVLQEVRKARNIHLNGLGEITHF